MQVDDIRNTRLHNEKEGLGPREISIHSYQKYSCLSLFHFFIEQVLKPKMA